jgi:Ribose/xylose/arabinose/galactoside ABC-type transport systems, permease components
MIKKKDKLRIDSDTIVRVVLNNKALLILISLMILAQIFTKGVFFSEANLSSVSRQIVAFTMLGIGFTVVLASGCVDLSVGHMLSFVGVAYALMSKEMPLGMAIILSLALGAMSGFLNGLISEKLRLVPFIVTLATAQIFRGLASLLSNGQSISGLSAASKFIGQGIIFGVPFSFIVTIILTIIVAVMMYKTQFGCYVIATGGNPEAASVSGINISKIKILSFVIMGVFAAVGAIILTGRVSMAQPTAGAGMEMDAIAAVVIGGTPMSGGKARVGGTVFGCLVIGVMNNLLNLMGVSSFWQWVAKGCIIILAILLDAQTERIFSKRLNKK